jgi:hypothetical protein
MVNVVLILIWLVLAIAIGRRFQRLAETKAASAKP